MLQHGVQFSGWLKDRPHDHVFLGLRPQPLALHFIEPAGGNCSGIGSPAVTGTSSQQGCIFRHHFATGNVSVWRKHGGMTNCENCSTNQDITWLKGWAKSCIREPRGLLGRSGHQKSCKVAKETSQGTRLRTTKTARQNVPAAVEE